jgi:hypothetical protein
MKKYSQKIAHYLGWLVFGDMTIFTLTYLATKTGKFLSPMRCIRYIIWFGLLFYITEQIQDVLHQENKHRIEINWQFRAKVLTYTFTLIFAEIYLLIEFLLTPTAHIERMFIVITAAFIVIAYLVIIITNYFQSLKGLKGMSKEEVFE